MVKVRIITGCSCGLGEEIAQAAIEHGEKVVATARDPDIIQALKSKGAIIAKLDVTSLNDILTGGVQDILKRVGQVDI